MSTNIRLTRICQYCGKDFEAKTTVTAYCSHPCAQRAYKDRKRAEKIGVSNEHTRQVIERPMEEIRAKEFLNMADASKLLGVSRWTLWRHIKAGTINAVKIGSRTVVRRVDIDRLFERPATQMEQSQPVPVVALSDCYTLAEIRHKYGISDKALFDLIQRNDIPKQYKGKYAYVPKQPIDNLLSSNSND